MREIKTLIVDDEWLIRLELKRMLQPLTHVRVVAEASTIAEAASLTEAHHPDLVFLDLQLGDGLGVEFLKRAKQKFKLIYITAFECDLPQVKKYPALACLSKPINREKLYSVMRTVANGEGA